MQLCWFCFCFVRWGLCTVGGRVVPLVLFVRAITIAKKNRSVLVRSVPGGLMYHRKPTRRMLRSSPAMNWYLRLEPSPNLNRNPSPSLNRILAVLLRDWGSLALWGRAFVPTRGRSNVVRTAHWHVRPLTIHREKRPRPATTQTMIAMV
jgi:hypothetical protein